MVTSCDKNRFEEKHATEVWAPRFTFFSQGNNFQLKLSRFIVHDSMLSPTHHFQRNQNFGYGIPSVCLSIDPMSWWIWYKWSILSKFVKRNRMKVMRFEEKGREWNVSNSYILSRQQRTEHFLECWLRMVVTHSRFAGRERERETECEAKNIESEKKNCSTLNVEKRNRNPHIVCVNTHRVTTPDDIYFGMCTDHIHSLSVRIHSPR